MEVRPPKGLDFYHDLLNRRVRLSKNQSYVRMSLSRGRYIPGYGDGNESDDPYWSKKPPGLLRGQIALSQSEWTRPEWCPQHLSDKVWIMDEPITRAWPRRQFLGDHEKVSNVG